MATVPSVKLNNGIEMPPLGFGVFQIAPEEVMGPVRVALEAGCRLIDTAWGYRNEEGVGRAVRESGIPREQLFITTKLANSEHGYDRALRAFDASLAKLGNGLRGPLSHPLACTHGRPGPPARRTPGGSSPRG